MKKKLKTITTRTITKGILKGEKLKIKELNDNEQKQHNNYKYIITLGEYDDIDHEAEIKKEALEFYNDYENN